MNAVKAGGIVSDKLGGRPMTCDSCPDEAVGGPMACQLCGRKNVKTVCADEPAEHVALCRGWALYARRFGVAERLLFAIPNGGRRDMTTGARLKAEGVRAGGPDMFLAVPRQNAPGLFLELKKQKGGRVSENQNPMHEALSQAGYPVCICRGWDEAKRAIDGYIGRTLD